jgi:hypothetical protein
VKELAQLAAVMYMSICNAIDPTHATAALEARSGAVGIVIECGISPRVCKRHANLVGSALNEISRLFERMSVHLPPRDTVGFGRRIKEFSKRVGRARSTSVEINSLRQRLIQTCAAFGVSMLSRASPQSIFTSPGIREYSY